MGTRARLSDDAISLLLIALRRAAKVALFFDGERGAVKAAVYAQIIAVRRPST